MSGSAFGRRDETARILGRIREAAAGRPGVVHLSGPEGIGKSCLLTVVRDAVADEAAMLVATCTEGDEDFAVARRLFGPAADEVLASAQDDYTRMRGLYGLVADLTDRKPLVLAVDDAHRCDPATVRWLGFLARRASSRPICVILTYPCAGRLPVESAFSEVISVLDTFDMTLGPFCEADLREQIERGFGVPPHDDFVRACYEITAAFPRFTQRWIDELGGRGLLPDPAGAERLLAEGADGRDEWLVSWVRGETDPAVWTYLTAVAVLGSAAPNATSALFGLSSPVAEAAREKLTYVSILTAEGRFRSASLRDKVLATLAPEYLRSLRSKAARMLTDEGWAHTDIADLLMEQPQLDEVWMFCALRDAARDVTTSPNLAIGYLRRVLEAVPDHVETRIELAHLLATTEPEAALAAFAGVLNDVPDITTRARLAVRYGIVALQARRSREAYGPLSEVRSTLPANADPALRRQVDTALLVTGLHDLSTVEPTLALARGMVAPTDTRPVENWHLASQLARIEVLTGTSVARALELARLAIPTERGPHDWWDLFPIQSLHLCGERAEAMAMADKVAGYAVAQGDGVTEALALTARAAMKLEYGDLAEAEADAEKALLTQVAGGRAAEDLWTRTVLASVLVRRGENERAEQLFASLRTPHDPIEHAWALAARGRWLRNGGDQEAALDVLLRCGRELDAMGVHNPVIVPWWVDAVTLLTELGRHEEARALAGRFRDVIRGWNTPRARGYGLLAEGLATGDACVLEQAVAELAAAGARLYECQAQTALGTALLRAGQDKHARRHLRAAVDLAVVCGDITGANTARTVLTEAGGRMGEVSTTPLDALTGGERRVARLAAEGRSNREIAEALFVTVRTVESHLSNAYRKLGVQTRADLATQLR